MPQQLTLIGITGLPEVRPGDDLAALLAQAAEAQGTPFQSGEVVVVAQKVVSKAEGRLVALEGVTPSPLAVELARQSHHDPRHVEVVLQEARRIVRTDQGVIITETRHGFRCANSGVDASNVPGEKVVSLLPVDPDASAQKLRKDIRERTGAALAVIISDTFGRPWREGAVNVAIGVAGLAPLKDYRGQHDGYGHPLKTTVIAVADELAAAAELVTHKLDRIPVVVIRGYSFNEARGNAQELLRHSTGDLFR